MIITLEKALTAAHAILEQLRKDQKEAVIAICDAHGELITLFKTDNAPYPSIQIAQNKAYTSAREKRDSMEIGDVLRDNTIGYQIQYWGDPKITGFGGGVVVKDANGRTIGAIGVSGLPELEDIYYAKIGIASINK
jgi:glc operon protein GlcG